MGMADSLVERANEVATSGLVDEAFQVGALAKPPAARPGHATRAGEQRGAILIRARTGEGPLRARKETVFSNREDVQVTFVGVG